MDSMAFGSKAVELHVQSWGRWQSVGLRVGSWKVRVFVTRIARVVKILDSVSDNASRLGVKVR